MDPIKVTVWAAPDGYHLTRSDEPEREYIYPAHHPKRLLEIVSLTIEPLSDEE